MQHLPSNLRALCLALLGVGLVSGTRLAAQPTPQAPPTWANYSDTWPAVDALKRGVATFPKTGPPREQKTVAMFYYIWHGQHGTALHDISKILDANPEDPQWGPKGIFHHWGEPLYGYYLADDEWVIRKNAQMLSDAGVDVIFFDVTNAFAYTNVFLRLCEVYTQIRAEGNATPQIAFLTNSASGKTVQAVYDALYAPGLYRELWFQWNSKPIILAKVEELSPALQEFFTVRRSWAWEPGEDKWPWLESLPQQGGWHGTPENLEQMVVETAQHPIGHHEGLGLGKSNYRGHQPEPGQYRTEFGLYFTEQWNRALHADPQLIFITQWNEWIAQRFITESPMRYAGLQLQTGDTYFVDLFSAEFNRDIEPPKGRYGDNYYYQMVDRIRKFKGTHPLPEASAPQTMTLTASHWDDWNEVLPEYRDDRGDVFHRDHPGYGALHFVNRTGRNDFIRAKAARDSNALYFFVETEKEITPPAGEAWMELLLRLRSTPEAESWEGWHFLVQWNQELDAYQLLCSTGGWNWEIVGTVEHVLDSRRLALAIPRSMLGLPPASTEVDLTFKWTDNMQERTPLDWILNGDTAPNGRFQYHYTAPDIAQTSSAWNTY